MGPNKCLERVWLKSARCHGSRLLTRTKKGHLTLCQIQCSLIELPTMPFTWVVSYNSQSVTNLNEGLTSLISSEINWEEAQYQFLNICDPEYLFCMQQLEGSDVAT